MSFVPGLGIVKGMALTLRRFFEPKVTVMYPEVRLDVPHKFRGRLQLLYDEWGTLKCETCFQCAQACPIECIDMGGIDTRGRYHVHWGAPETYVPSIFEWGVSIGLIAATIFLFGLGARLLPVLAKAEPSGSH